MSKSSVVIPVLAGIVGVGAIGILAYAFARRPQRATLALVTHAGGAPTSSPRPALRESIVVPRSPVSNRVLRSEAELESAEATVRCNARLPPPASADDGEPPQADELGGYGLSRATQSERRLCEGDLDIDLDDVADPRDDEDEDERDNDEGLDPRVVAARGSPAAPTRSATDLPVANEAGRRDRTRLSRKGG